VADGDPSERWHKILDAGELLDGRVKTVTVGDRNLAVTRVGDEYGALDNRCPHQGGPLGEGSIEDCWLRCPWHGYEYNPLDGKPPEGFSDAAACSKVIESGLAMSSFSGKQPNSAHPPLPPSTSPNTASPISNRVTPEPTAVTTPATSVPSIGCLGLKRPYTRTYAGLAVRVSQSERFNETDRISRTTSRGPRVGDWKLHHLKNLG
jgi:nitrite reductase/ring-hydroxylating ferredoxin subunit